MKYKIRPNDQSAVSLMLTALQARAAPPLVSPSLRETGYARMVLHFISNQYINSARTVTLSAPCSLTFWRELSA